MHVRAPARALGVGGGLHTSTIARTTPTFSCTVHTAEAITWDLRTVQPTNTMLRRLSGR